MQSALLGIALLGLYLALGQAAVPCQRRDFGSSSFVCTCNSTYCDEEDAISPPSFGQGVLYTSDKSSKRFEPTTYTFSSGNGDPDRVTLTVHKATYRQQIKGFGGAFTDAAGANINKLSVEAQDKLMNSYFNTKSGLGYNLGRINIGGCDFSERTYTYCDTPGDEDLNTFALQPEDLNYKIPYIKMAESIRGSQLKLFGSPWTAPPWMKSNNDYSGKGFLLPQYYQPWANYFIRFLDEYAANGVDIWGLTAQNEPEDGNIEDFSFNCMGWNASTQREFVADFLGPTLDNSGYEGIQLMIYDGQRPKMPLWTSEVFESQKAFEYTDGVAIHWYSDNFFDVENSLELQHNNYPSKFMLYTEACTGYVFGINDVDLGNWNRGEKYMFNIIEDLNHWVTGWVDWNLVLDMQGGPNWAENYVDAPVIINEANDEFYKQPMFYALGHFSRFFSEHSFHISITEDSESGLQFVGVQRPDFGVAVVILNQDPVNTVHINLQDPDRGVMELDILPASMNTLLYY